MRGELSGSPPSILGLDFILSDWQIRQCLQNISNICIRILMMENIRYLDVCVKNLLFMYKVSTYFCRQCLNGLARYSQCLDPHDDQIDSSESWSLEPAQFPAAASRQAQGIMMDTLSTINHPQPQIRPVSDVSSMILLCYGYELLFV